MVDGTYSNNHLLRNEDLIKPETCSGRSPDRASIRLHSTVESIIDELPQAALSWTPGLDMNSPCVLIVHLAGAEQYWIGNVVGRDPSERDRDAEFQVQGLNAEALKVRLGKTLTHSREVLTTLTLEDLEKKRVSPRDGREFTVGWALTHALEHTALHVGHLQITQQWWKQQMRTHPK